MKILIKFPTRGRREKFFSTLDLYRSMSDNLENLKFLVSIDVDDETMNNEETIERLGSIENLNFFIGRSNSKVHAVNRDIPDNEEWDIIILASDDMIPKVKGYDSIIIEKMRQNFPDTDGVLWFNDGHQGTLLNTLSIMGRKYYDRFGYIYNPEYLSTWCDNEFTDVAFILNKQAYFDEVIINHEHPDWGFGYHDFIHAKNREDNDFDENLYKARKKLNFGYQGVIKALTYFTPTHRDLYLDFLVKSIPDGFFIIHKEGGQICDDGGYFSNGFCESTREKMSFLLHELNQMEEDEICLFCDVDIVFLANPKKYLSEHNQSDMVFQKAYDGYNTGFFLMRNKEKVRSLISDVIEKCTMYHDDQLALNELIKNHSDIEASNFDDRVLSPAALNGVKIWVDEELDIPEDTLVFHACWCVGVENKKRLLSYARDNFRAKTGKSVPEIS